MNDNILHAIECHCQECLDKWVKIAADAGNSSPSKCLCIHGLDGYETYKIDDNTIGVRPKWISVKDQDVPKEGIFLLFYYGGMSVGEYLYSEGEMEECPNFLCGSDVIWNVTHWMKLPEKPNE